MTDFGIPNANLGDNFTSGLGEFDMDGVGSNFGDGLGVGRCNCPLIESEQQFQWVANITKMKGNHQFKFGADVRYAQTCVFRAIPTAPASITSATWRHRMMASAD